MRSLGCPVKAIIASAFLALSPASVQAGMIPLYGPGLGGAHVDITVQSYKEALFEHVIRQRYDFSCGSASLATLLYFHYYIDVDEATVMQAMYAVGDQEKIRKEGFSLLDMKKYLASIGFDADGYRVSLEQLEKVGVPAIALINLNGYLHFVVIKGVHNGLVLVGDPALGARKIPIDKFNQMWNQVAFVIKNDIQTGKDTFNVAEEWQIRSSADFGLALSNQALADFSVYTTPTPSYLLF